MGYMVFFNKNGTISPPPMLSDPDMHHGMYVSHVPWCMPWLQTSGFLQSQWRRKRSQHSRCMHNPTFYISGKRPICKKLQIYAIHEITNCKYMFQYKVSRKHQPLADLSVIGGDIQRSVQFLSLHKDEVISWKSWIQHWQDVAYPGCSVWIVNKTLANLIVAWYDIDYQGHKQRSIYCIHHCILMMTNYNNKTKTLEMITITAITNNNNISNNDKNNDNDDDKFMIMTMLIKVW